MLKYSLVRNPLVDKPEDYTAQTSGSDTYDKAKFIKRLLGKGSLVTETDALAVLNAIESTVADIISEGSTINLPLFNTSFSISGVFDGAHDSFDNNRHKLNINITKGTLLRNLEKSIICEKAGPTGPVPRIQEVKDSLSGRLNEMLTPGGVVEIYGYNLKIQGETPPCGLWFIKEDDNSSFQAQVLITNKPSVVIGVIPDLLPGNYRVKIVTRFSGGRELKEPKSLIYPLPLSAE
jgi:hypothetical protein